MALATSLSAYDLDAVKDSFQSFADETANALPLAASMGLNWNDAYGGKFPHFGIGLTAGAVFLPSEAFEEVYALTGNDGLGDYGTLGVPLPVYSIDARLGLPVIPFEIGFKIGILNPDMLDLEGVSVGFKMIGGDIRWGIIEDKKFLPDVSLGFAYTWLNGDIIVPVADQTVDISGTGAGTTLSLEDSDMNYNWSTNVMDLKAQVSKKLLFINLSAGAGYSYGFSTAGGGLTASNVYVDGTLIDSTQISQIEDATGLSVDPNGLNVLSEVNGGSFRLFGGVGLSIFILKIDMGVVYGLPSQSLGLSANARIQY
ncbi:MULTISPECIES: hypothetical protein [unclassified Oceanispirochaeta]|uniref:hypothetical protein n=1 Tax=unclassified Oceanispirochaeta TaxID=2635722 RepID=UPI000E09B784|nr:MULTISPECIES: hypothetical protein [unclassified Oceanispirochaeta]MBF9019001.1 hypothetical protein [Oceanispirochaeta sp. M2]NPD75501.1 hypothetical protein [Oceanispirochaeta sp. M1]RDG28645.1 hypothetical protein DV872_25745 [Oceanispirochaeta sp. M1]